MPSKALETLFPALYEMENREEKVTVKEREFKGTPWDEGNPGFQPTQSWQRWNLYFSWTTRAPNM